MCEQRRRDRAKGHAWHHGGDVENGGKRQVLMPIFRSSSTVDHRVLGIAAITGYVGQQQQPRLPLGMPPRLNGVSHQDAEAERHTVRPAAALL